MLRHIVLVQFKHISNYPAIKIYCNLGICDDHDEIEFSRHNAVIGQMLNIASRRFEKKIEYCQVQGPNGTRLRFSSTIDTNNPDTIR